MWLLHVHVHTARHREIKLLSLTLTLAFVFVRLSMQQLFHERWIGDHRYAESWLQSFHIQQAGME